MGHVWLPARSAPQSMDRAEVKCDVPRAHSRWTQYYSETGLAVRGKYLHERLRV
jgi:hypothetical protein